MTDVFLAVDTANMRLQIDLEYFGVFGIKPGQKSELTLRAAFFVFRQVIVFIHSRQMVMVTPAMAGSALLVSAFSLWYTIWLLDTSARHQVLAYFKSLVFDRATLDLEGYRMGSLNPDAKA